MRNLIWIGTILIVVGAASAGVHMIDTSLVAHPAVQSLLAPTEVAANGSAVAQAGWQLSLDLELSVAMLLLGLGMVYLGRRACSRL